LTGPWAEPHDVRAALDLIEAVRAASKSFRPADRLAVRVSARAAMHRMKGVYGADR
jgi:hypothetical protein